MAPHTLVGATMTWGGPAGAILTSGAFLGPVVDPSVAFPGVVSKSKRWPLGRAGIRFVPDLSVSSPVAAVFYAVAL